MKKLILAGVLSLFAVNCMAGSITLYGDKSESSQTTTTSPDGQTTTTRWSVNCTGNMTVVCAVAVTDGPSTPKMGEQVKLAVYENGNVKNSQTGILEQYSVGNNSMQISIIHSAN